MNVMFIGIQTHLPKVKVKSIGVQCDILGISKRSDKSEKEEEADTEVEVKEEVEEEEMDDIFYSDGDSSDDVSSE